VTAFRMARQKGFSLVELMVAMTLSLVLLAGALSILYSTKVTNTENERLARLQENGRAVVELMLRDARASGYRGCSRPSGTIRFDNDLPNPTNVLWNFEEPMRGYDAGGGGWSPGVDAGLVPAATPPTAGSDILALRTTRQGTPVFRLSSVMANSGSPLSLDGPAGASLPAGSTVIITDCAGSSAFAVNTFAAGAPATLTHAALAREFALNAQVVQMDTVAYYVSDSTSGLGPALWRRIGAANPQLLIEGVQNLQVLYGEDLNNDLLADDYRAANAVTNWGNVVALTLAVLIQSEGEANLDVDTRTYTLLSPGNDFGPFNDRRQRAVFTTTATLRNRAQ
jgi:type IV pilus assembly protein PilW